MPPTHTPATVDVVSNSSHERGAIYTPPTSNTNYFEEAKTTTKNQPPLRTTPKPINRVIHNPSASYCEKLHATIVVFQQYCGQGARSSVVKYFERKPPPLSPSTRLSAAACSFRWVTLVRGCRWSRATLIVPKSGGLLFRGKLFLACDRNYSNPSEEVYPLFSDPMVYYQLCHPSPHP